MRTRLTPAGDRNPKSSDDLNWLVEQIWHELDEQVPRNRIRRVAIRMAARFDNAAVTTNIPLFVRHLTREWLKSEINRCHAKM
jgi:hypothetical protein